MRKRIQQVVFALSFLVIAALGAISLVNARNPADAYAGASVEGVREGAEYRALISSGGDDRVRRIVYVESGSHATGGANTPVPSAKVCGMAGVYHYAEVQFTGTLAGTNPTLAIKWQNSKDNGATWTDVGTWTTINATVTPTNQKNTVADHGDIVLMNANTPVTTPAVMYGDCWRTTYTMTGTGSVAGNFTIIGAEK